MACDDGHRLDERVHDEGIGTVLGVGEAQRVAEFGNPVLDLDAGVHLHEEVTVALDDALEGRRRVEPDGGAEALRLGLHLAQHAKVRFERLGLAGLAGRAAARDLSLEPFLGDRDLDQLLLVHLQRAVASAEGDAPTAVAEQLDLVVPRALDVEFEQHIAVVAGAGRLDLAQDFAHEPGDDLGVGEDALALAAAAADRLQAEAPPGILDEELARLLLELGREVLDREQVELSRIGRLEDGRGQVGEIRLGIGERGHVESVLAGELVERRAIGVTGEQRAHGRVVDAGGDRNLVGDRRALGLVLCAGRGLRPRAGPDEGETRFFDGAHEARVLGHEAVAGEDEAVVVLAADPDDVADARDPLLPGGAGVVGHRVHPRRVHHAEFGCEGARVDDAVLLREQNPDARNAHLAEDVDRLLADRTAADDQDAHVLAGEGPYPGRSGLREAAFAVDERVSPDGPRLVRRQGGHQWNSLCTESIGPGV